MTDELVKRLRAELSGSAAAALHKGATSQDVIVDGGRGDDLAPDFAGDIKLAVTASWRNRDVVGVKSRADDPNLGGKGQGRRRRGSRDGIHGSPFIRR